MAGKRRMFNIEMPEDDAESFPAGKVKEAERRRGPMAAAIRETAESARERHAAEAKIRAENDALAHEHVRIKRLGLVVDLIPLERIQASKLVRDRRPRPDPDLEELKESIRAIGLSNPIRVEEANGGFELVQGWRRLSAFRGLHEETGDERFATIPAAIWGQGETLDSLYRRMVDENLVRKDISFAEMAQLAVDYAADPGTAETDPDRAVAELFRSASYQKRSYIRSFIQLVERLGPHLNFAHEIPRALGLSLVMRMEQMDGLLDALAAELANWDDRSAGDEISVLRRFAGQGDDAAQKATPKKTGGKARTSFQFDRPEGKTRCTASAGKLEIRLDRDFSTLDRRKLEQAVKRLLKDLD